VNGGELQVMAMGSGTAIAYNNSMSCGIHTLSTSFMIMQQPRILGKSLL
jgi:hypothetical protein